jgi:hypothetical protein
LNLSQRYLLLLSPHVPPNAHAKPEENLQLCVLCIANDPSGFDADQVGGVEQLLHASADLQQQQQVLPVIASVEVAHHAPEPHEYSLLLCAPSQQHFAALCVQHLCNFTQQQQQQQQPFVMTSNGCTDGHAGSSSSSCGSAIVRDDSIDSSSSNSRSKSTGVASGAGICVRPLAASNGWLINSSAASSTSSTNSSTDSSSTCSSMLRLYFMDATAMLNKRLN